MSEVDSKLDAAWRAASREEPPAAIDDALRAAARRAVHAGPARTRHQRTWPLAAAAVVAVLAISIVQLTPVEQVAPPTILADSTARQAASTEQQATVPPAAPAAIDAARRGDKTPIAAQSNASGVIAGTTAPMPERDLAALKLKRDEGGADTSVKQERADPFPAAPAENKAATDTLAASPPPPTVAAASKPTPSPSGAPAFARPAVRSNEPAAAPPQMLAKAAPESTRAKDAAPLPPEEWIKRIRRMQDEGRKDDVVKELAAFRAAYKERADALLPPDLREMK